MSGYRPAVNYSILAELAAAPSPTATAVAPASTALRAPAPPRQPLPAQAAPTAPPPAPPAAYVQPPGPAPAPAPAPVEGRSPDLFLGKPPAPPRFRGRVRVAAIAAAVTLAGLLGWYVVSRPPSPWAHHWDARVSPIASFVEDQRGLTFSHPVTVEFLPDATFRKKVGGDGSMSAADRKQLDDTTAELRALGVAEGQVDLAAAAKQVEQDRVVGLYVPKDKKVYVRGSAMTPDVRVTLAHELTHALQDQHRDLARLTGNAKLQSVYQSLIEGDAVDVQNAYVKQMSEADQAAYAKQDESVNATATKNDANVPAVLTNALSFPYVFGPTFVDALRAQGGTPTVDQAFARPPSSELEIVDPERYLSGFKPVPVSAPSLTRTQTKLWTDDFGVATMTQVFGQRVGYSPAWAAMQGWKGDNGVVYRESGKVCVAVDTALDAASIDVFQAVSKQWAASVPGAQVTRRGDIVEIRSCDPGPSFRGPSAASPAPFDVMAVRSDLLDEAFQNWGVPVPQAVCDVDFMIKQLGPTGTVGLASATDPNTVTQALEQLGPAAAQACRSTAG